MAKIKIKNFGPIRDGFLKDDGWIDIKKVTVLIGNQGSGKSTLAKLISTFMWMEKALTRGDYDKKVFEQDGILGRYLAYHKIDTYFRSDRNSKKSRMKFVFPNDSEIGYEGDSFKFEYKSGDLKITESPAANYYPLPQIMYFPADRNFLSSVDDLKTQRIFSPALSELLYEFDNSKKEIQSNLLLPINNAELEYSNENDVFFIVGNGYKIKLSESSSGFQSFVPLFLVSWFLSNQVKKQSETIEPMRSDELERFKKGVTDIYSSQNLTDEQKRAAISALSTKFNKSAFISIVEEPEQNLFPDSQWQMLKSLLEFNNQNNGSKLIITTHSPYIISYLNIAIEAHNLKSKIEVSNHPNGLLNQVNQIAPIPSLVAAEDVVVYELNQKEGTISRLSTFEGIPSDKNYLNLSIRESNRLFDSLLALEEDL